MCEGKRSAVGCCDFSGRGFFRKRQRLAHHHHEIDGMGRKDMWAFQKRECSATLEGTLTLGRWLQTLLQARCGRYWRGCGLRNGSMSKSWKGIERPRCTSIAVPLPFLQGPFLPGPPVGYSRLEYVQDHVPSRAVLAKLLVHHHVQRQVIFPDPLDARDRVRSHRIASEI